MSNDDNDDNNVVSLDALRLEKAFLEACREAARRGYMIEGPPGYFALTPRGAKLGPKLEKKWEKQQKRQKQQGEAAR